MCFVIHELAYMEMGGKSLTLSSRHTVLPTLLAYPWGNIGVSRLFLDSIASLSCFGKFVVCSITICSPTIDRGCFFLFQRGLSAYVHSFFHVAHGCRQYGIYMVNDQGCWAFLHAHVGMLLLPPFCLGIFTYKISINKVGDNPSIGI